MLRLKRPFHRHTKIISLLISQLSQLHTKLLKVQTSHFFIQMLRQEVHAQRVAVRVVPQFDLGQHLVRKRGTHHEAGFVATVNLGRGACNGRGSLVLFLGIKVWQLDVGATPRDQIKVRTRVQ